MSAGDMAIDPAIKLFGRSIALPEGHIPANSDGLTSSRIPPDQSQILEDGEIAGGESEDRAVSDSTRKAENSSGPDNDEDYHIKVKSVQDDPNLKEGESQSENQCETNSGNQSKLKKPDKVVPCPRCHSSDTKFCYFNNYNVNQRRHFCKNCQRYWTAGGMTRNVPVGAGRRKNKQMASQNRQIILSADVLPAFITDFSASSIGSLMGSGATVLRFGPEGPLSQSMTSMLNLTSQNNCLEAHTIPLYSSPQNSFKQPPCGSPFAASSFRGNEFPETHMLNRMSKGSTAGPSSSAPSSQLGMQYYPYYPGIVPMNGGWNVVTPNAAQVAANSNYHNSVQWCSPQMLAAPGFCASGMPFQFVPATPYWGCMPAWPNRTSNAPDPIAANTLNGCVQATDAAAQANVFPGDSLSLSLGKHMRENNSQLGGGERAGRSFPTVKMSKVDTAHPNNADNKASWSSILSALAMNLNQQKDSVAGAKGSGFTPDADLSFSKTYQKP